MSLRSDLLEYAAVAACNPTTYVVCGVASSAGFATKSFLTTDEPFEIQANNRAEATVHFLDYCNRRWIEFAAENNWMYRWWSSGVGSSTRDFYAEFASWSDNSVEKVIDEIFDWPSDGFALCEKK